MTTRFLNGFATPFRGLQYIQKNKYLWPFLLMPMVIMLIFSLGLFALMLNEYPRMMAWMGFVNLWPALYYLLWVFMVIGFVLLGSIIGVFVSRLITFPLYSFAVEKILIRRGALRSSSFQGKSRLAQVWTLATSSMGKTLLLLSVSILLFVFAFLPVLDVLIGFFASYLLAIDCFDLPLEILHPSLKTRMSHWQSMTPELLGMTCVLALGLTIPGLSFIVIPSTIVGNCLLVSGGSNVS